jgi:plastocyanin
VRNRRSVVTVVVLAALSAVAALLVPGSQAAGIDPRAGGFEIALGEWAVSPETKAIRPGPVTFVVTNRGKLVHGLRIRSHDHGGHGHGGDREKVDERTYKLTPGRADRLTLDLAPGTYEVYCIVSGHHNHGMYMLLEVREDAPFVVPKPAAPKTIDIQGFAYKPPTFNARVGATVKWVNRDAAPHTVSAQNGSFTSKALGKGGTYSRKFTRAGTYQYLCAVHPGMRAKVVVK